MEEKELYKKVISNLKIEKIHPLHKAIMEECCENAINNSEKIVDEKMLMYAVQVAFISSLNALIGSLKGGLKLADEITLNYRNQQFIINKNSPLLKKND